MTTARSRTRGARVAACALAGALLLVGCGEAASAPGNDVATDDEASAATNESPLTESPTPSASGEPTGTGVEYDTDGGIVRLEGPAEEDELAARVDTYLNVPDELKVRTPIDGDIPSGETLAVLVCGVPICSEHADAMEEAATELGWSVERIDLGVSPEEFAAAYSRAVELQPSAVVGSGLSPDFFSDQLQQLGDAGIPVIQWAAPAGLDTPGVAWTMLDDPMFGNVGVRFAEWFTQEGDASARVAVFNVEQYHGSTVMSDTLREYVPVICPDCTVDYQSVGVDDIGTNMPSIVTAYLQQNSDTDFVFCTFGDLCQGVGQAIQDAGSSARVVTGDPATTNFQNINLGVEHATQPLPTGPTGWSIVDAAARLIVCQGSDIDPSACPGLAETRVPFAQQIVTDVSDAQDPTIGAVVGYQDAFRSLWDR